MCPVVGSRPLQLLELTTINNWGLAIILLTPTVKLFLYPLSGSGPPVHGEHEEIRSKCAGFRSSIAITGRNCLQTRWR